MGLRAVVEVAASTMVVVVVETVLGAVFDSAVAADVGVEAAMMLFARLWLESYFTREI